MQIAATPKHIGKNIVLAGNVNLPKYKVHQISKKCVTVRENMTRGLYEKT